MAGPKKVEINASMCYRILAHELGSGLLSTVGDRMAAT